MKTRTIRVAIVAGAAALVAMLGYMPSAYSAIGASNSPITTGRIDLRSAQYQAGPNNVKVCFDQAVTAIANSGFFFLEGYDSLGRFYAFPAGIGTLDANPNCVLLPVGAPNAAPPSSIVDMTILSVFGPGAVTGPTGALNTPGAVALSGNLNTNLDRTDALELQSANPLGGGGVDFNFERAVDTDSLEQDAGDYGYQTSAGDVGTCVSNGALTYFGNTVRVSGPWVPDPATATPAAACGNPNQGVRFFTDTTAAPAGMPATCTTDAAAMDRGTLAAGGNDVNAKFNPLGVFIPSGATATDDPDMTGAVKSGTNTIDATLDEAVFSTGAGAPFAGCFLGFEGDGDVHYGDTALVTNPTGASNVVRVTFNTLPTNQLQIFGMLPGAVWSSVTAGEPNSYGIQEFVGDRVLPGFSDSGDLEQVTTLAPLTLEQARFCYDTDEAVNPAVIVPAAHQILDNSGSVIGTGTGVVGVAGNCATIQFLPGVVSNPIAAAGGVNGVAILDGVGTPDVVNGTSFDVAGGNLSIIFAHVALNGPAPTAGLPPSPVPLPPLPAPVPGVPGAPGAPAAPPGATPTITIGGSLDLCDATRPTASLNELLIGDENGDKMCGYGGADELRGHAGLDDLRGGPGDDLIVAGSERDHIRGGPGADRMRGGSGADTIKGGGGRDTARGGADNDLCRAEVVGACEA